MRASQASLRSSVSVAPSLEHLELNHLTGSVDRVLVTGGSGFVGSAVVRVLVAAGYPVRALVRPSSPRANLAQTQVELVEGDMRDAASMARAMTGIRYVMHVAADYRLWARDRDEIRRNNVAGTRTIMEAALREGVERIVYTSSVAALALRADGASADEVTAQSEASAVGAYKQSKVAAQELVEAMIQQSGLPAIIVNPSTPIGPRDIRPTPTGRLIVEAAAGRMPGYVDTGLNLVHVDDVAAGHLAALTRGRIGERYILGGQDVLLADMLRDIARLVGRRGPLLRFPRRLLFPAAAVAEMWATRTGREPFLTRDGLRMAKHRMFFSSAKATRELGFVARPYGEGLVDAISWFRGVGYLQ
jgi:dihydroflavonol-4-reductase